MSLKPMSRKGFPNLPWPDDLRRRGADAMPVGVLTLEIQIPYAHSLKEKRAVLRKMRDRLRARFNVAVAELDHQDVWQRATLGVVSISDSQKFLDSVFRQVLAEAESILGDDVADHFLEYF
jgi:uncharacterized protein YlxP (DUF503 family)